MKGRVAKLLLLLGATCFALVVGELGARLLARESDGPGMRFLTRYDPVYGWSKTANATLEHATPEFEATERTNARGLRGPDIPVERRPGTYRVLMLGDSFLEGYTVGDDDLVSEVVRRELAARLGAPVEVVNSGTVGYSTDQELLFYETEGRAFRPDATVLLFYVNDVWFNRQPRYWRGEKPWFELVDGTLELRNQPVPEPEPTEFANALSGGTGVVAMVRRADSWLGGRSTLYRTVRELVRENPNTRHVLIRSGLAPVPGEWMPWKVETTPELAAAWASTEALLARLEREVEADGSSLTVFHVPSRPAVDPEDWERTKWAYAMDDDAWNPAQDGVVLGRICAEHGIDCLLPLDAFRAEAARATDGDPPLYFRDDPHWTAAGHRLAGRLIAEAVAAQLTAAPP